MAIRGAADPAQQQQQREVVVVVAGSYVAGSESEPGATQSGPISVTSVVTLTVPCSYLRVPLLNDGRASRVDNDEEDERRRE